MILFKSEGIIEIYLLKNYKKIYSRYEYKSGFFYDQQQVKSFKKDLLKYGFLTEIKVFETRGIHESGFAEQSLFTLDEDGLSNHLKDHTKPSHAQQKHELLTIDNVAELLKVTRPTVYKLIKEEKLKAVAILSRKRIRLSDYLGYIKTLQ